MSIREPSLDVGDAAQVDIAERVLGSAGHLLAASGELDIATAPVLRERLTALIDGGVRGLVVDLRPVTFMDSVALAAILHARSRMPEDGRMAIVLEAGSYTRLIFEIAGLPERLDLFEREDLAVAHVTG
jgi:anti-sigma B factor antagonist